MPLQLPLDDITEVMRRCVNGKLSRSAIHRCLVRHGLNRRPRRDKLPVGLFEPATVGFNPCRSQALAPLSVDLLVVRPNPMARRLHSEQLPLLLSLQRLALSTRP
jgi:hypothetical protein